MQARGLAPNGDERAERLALLLRLALGGKMPAASRAGPAWFDPQDIGSVFLEFADLAPFVGWREKIEGAAPEVVKQRVAKALSRWLSERAEDVPPGSGLRPREVALALHVLSLVASRETPILPTMLPLEGPEGETWPTGKETARALRRSACEKLAVYLLDQTVVDPTVDGPPPTDDALRTLCTDLAQAMRNRTALIPTPHWDAAPRRPIEHIYMPTRVVVRPDNANSIQLAGEAVVALQAQRREIESAIQKNEAREDDDRAEDRKERGGAGVREDHDRAEALRIELSENADALDDLSSGRARELGAFDEEAMPIRDGLPLRCVVLGAPGAGKTTLSTVLCHVQAGGRRLTRPPAHGAKDPPSVDSLWGSDAAAPERVGLVVVLRDFQRTHGDRSFVEFLADWSTARLEVATTRLDLDRLLGAGLADVVFDGLDELLDGATRQAVRDQIEAFAARYPDAGVLVTSRIVGYELASLAEDTFSVATLQPFNRAEQHEFARRFLSAHPQVERTDVDDITERFDRNTASIDDLSSNPLMLGLLANLFHASGYRDLPQTRASLYERTTTFLYERWDADRGIEVWDFQVEFLPTLSHLANEMLYGAMSMTPTRSEIITAALAFARTQQTTEMAARKHVDRLIAIATGRAWVLMEVGLDDAGEALYAFAHKTFAEYFAALHVIRTYDEPDALASEVQRRLALAPDDLVCDLVFELRAKQFNAAADRLATHLLALDQGWHMSCFLLRCASRCGFRDTSVLAAIAYAAGRNAMKRGRSESDRQSVFENLVFSLPGHRMAFARAARDVGLLADQRVSHLASHYDLQFAAVDPDWSRERSPLDPRALTVLRGDPDIGEPVVGPRALPLFTLDELDG